MPPGSMKELVAGSPSRPDPLGPLPATVVITPVGDLADAVVRTVSDVQVPNSIDREAKGKPNWALVAGRRRH